MKNHLILALLFIGFAYTNACCGGGDHESPMIGDSYWNIVGGTPFESNGKVRTYYIAADEVLWDYAPDGYNVINGQPWNEEEADFCVRKEGRIGSKYVKCRYRQFTSGTFKFVKARTLHEKHLGFMGPTIRGEVGDTIKIVFLNRCRFPVNIYSHGVFDDGDNRPVETGFTRTYKWEVSERAGPGMHDGSSIQWKYTSNVDTVPNFYAGLVGNIAITKKGWAKKDGSPKDVDREIFWMFSVTNENANPLIDTSIKRYVKKPYNMEALKKDSGFSAANWKYGINGYIFGNGPLVTMKKGERVRWYVISLGGGRDIHTPHWHGNILLIDGMHMDVASILPGESVIADMVPDDVGIWLHHCHVSEHFIHGMITRFAVVE